MTREEELKEEFRMFCDIAPKTMVVDADNIFNILKIGMEWADQHPRKGFWDANKILAWISQNIDSYCKLSAKKFNNLLFNLSRAMED